MSKKSNRSKNCDVCRHTGLALFFLRWSAVALNSEIAPFGSSAILTDADLAAAMKLPPIKHSRYVLRQLRPGYLHVYHETAPLWLAAAKKLKKDPEAKHWEVYRVTPSGALISDTDGSFITKDDFDCKTDPTHIFTALVYRLREAHKSGKIWVAFSANLWNTKLRAQNKMDPETMDCIDVPALLKGKKPINSVAPDAAWIDSHVAEFATGYFGHASLDPSFPFKPHYHEGATLQKRFAELDSVDSETKGKSLIYLLRDPAGITTDLGDVSRARHKKGLQEAESEHWKLGTAARLKLLRDQAQLNQTLKAPKPGELMSALPTDAQGRPLDTARRPLFDARQRFPLPPVDQRSAWVSCGAMDIMSYTDNVRMKVLPETARLFLFADGSNNGLAFAPAEDLAEKRVDESMAKMNRLHQRPKLKKFIDDFSTAMEKQATLLDDHDADRNVWLCHVSLKKCFARHYDPEENQYDASIAYMRDASGVLISWGGVSVSMEETMRGLLNASPMDDSGWALKALVGNQKGLYSQQAEFFQHANDWLYGMDNKLDKSYDSLAFALFDSDDNFRFSPRFAWLKSAGIGLSTGLGGFLGGAATHLLARAIGKAAPEDARNAVQALEMHEKFIDKTTGKVKDATVAAELKLEARVHAWCHQQSLLLDGYVSRKPPARPVYARMTLTVEQAAQVLLDSRGRGQKFTEMTREMLMEWRKMPAAAQGQTVQLDFLTTDQALQEARTLNKAQEAATEVKIALSTTLTNTPVVQITAERLGELYRQMHRYDGLKKALVSFLDKTAPQMAGKLTSALSQTAKVPTAALRGTTEWKGMFSLGGAVLQARMWSANAAKLENLEDKLLKLRNLTPEQQTAITDEMFLIKLGMTDNAAGVIGGVAELAGVGGKALELGGTEALMGTVSAFAGAAGAAANAWTNWRKAEGKSREGDDLFAQRYYEVMFAYGIAGGALALNGFAVITEWLAKRAAARAGVKFAAGRLLTFGLRGLPYVGWGVTIVAFVGEGIVVWYDRTKMEAWVENCAFGNKPTYKNADDEEAAFVKATEDVQEQALRETTAVPETK